MLKTTGIPNAIIDGIYTRNITLYPNSILFTIVNAQYLTMSNLWISNITQDTSDADWILISGMNTEVSINETNFFSMDLNRSPALSFVGTFSSISMNGVYFDSIWIDSDTSIIDFESLNALDMNQITFSNIKNHASESTNNYMIKISQTGNQYNI